MGGASKSRDRVDFAFADSGKSVELYLDNVQLHGIDYEAFGFKCDEF